MPSLTHYELPKLIAWRVACIHEAPNPPEGMVTPCWYYELCNGKEKITGYCSGDKTELKKRLKQQVQDRNHIVIGSGGHSSVTSTDHQYHHGDVTEKVDFENPNPPV